MPRKLPWLSGVPQGKPTTAASSESSPLPQRAKASTPEDLVDENLDPIAADTPRWRASGKKRKKDPTRTPSTSPPPAPPSVEYMREGFHADDRYMMVEDEFFSTAKTFTQHLHHAEYVRFKKLAASRGEGVLAEISRPVDGRTEQSEELKLALESEERMKKIRDAMREADVRKEEASEEEEEDEYMQDVHLADLMTGGGPSLPKNLMGLSKTKANTRAAAGLSQNVRNMEHGPSGRAERPNVPLAASSNKTRVPFRNAESSETDDDDLDAVAIRRKGLNKLNNGPSQSSITREQVGQVRHRSESRELNAFKRFTRAVESSTSDIKSVEVKPQLSSNKLGDNRQANLAPTSGSTDYKTSSLATDFLAKRRAEREKKEKEAKRKSKDTIDVPTFII